METIGKWLDRLVKWEYLGLCLLVLVTLVLHFSVIAQPDTPLFDEQHYVPDARRILQSEGTTRPEHPPLGKLIIAAGIQVFGDNPIGWRFFSVLFGTAGIVIFYFICRRLELSKKASYLVTFLMAFENLSFVQASIAMLDVYSIFFTLLAFWLYLKGRYAMSGVSVGLSALAKLSGALALLVIGLHWLLSGRKQSVRFIASMLLAPFSFVALMPVFDFAVWHRWIDPISQIVNMLKLTGSVTLGDYPYSRPWEWVLFPEVMPYWWHPHYTGMISPTLWVAIVPVVGYLIYRAPRGGISVLFPLSWFIGTYLLWIPAGLLTSRITYIYYFYPIVWSIAIGAGLLILRLLDIAAARQGGKLRRSIRIGIPVYLLLHVIAFIVLAPMSLWWSVPLGTLTLIFTLRVLGFDVHPRFTRLNLMNRQSAGKIEP